jgi:hypothetical protein
VGDRSLLALARKAFNYEWSLDHEINPPLETTNDYLGFASAVESVSWKLGLAQYHEAQAVTAIPGAIGDVPDRATAAGALMLASMSGHREAEAFEDAIQMAEAHSLAAAQAFHSTMDILANVLYIGLGLDSIQPISERKRNLYRVAQMLRSQNGKLASALESILASDACKYLVAFVNTTKHRRLVARRFRITIGEPRKFGLTFLPFKYEFGDVIQLLPSK